MVAKVETALISNFHSWHLFYFFLADADQVRVCTSMKNKASMLNNDLLCFCSLLTTQPSDEKTKCGHFLIKLRPLLFWQLLSSLVAQPRGPKLILLLSNSPKLSKRITPCKFLNCEIKERTIRQTKTKPMPLGTDRTVSWVKMIFLLPLPWVWQHKIYTLFLYHAMNLMTL